VDLLSAIEEKLASRLEPREWKLLCAYEEEAILKASDLGLAVIDIFSEEYPVILKRLDDPPLVLFVKGRPSALYTQRPLAIVGSRTPSSYTRKAGSMLSSLAASKASCVVSGLAIGCDTIAHYEALAKGSCTVAILAHGLDTVYPASNKALASDIVESGGCLVSEYPLGTPPRPNQFIARDRIQAGLSNSGILLQSSAQGGSMHAMRALLKIGSRIGVLVPPGLPCCLEDWSGATELIGLSKVIQLDPRSDAISSDLDILIGNNSLRDVERASIQPSLFDL